MRIDGSGAQPIQATASSSSDANNADNAATLTLEVPVTTPPQVVASVRCTVPKLAGKTLAQARAVIVRAHCSVSGISRKPSNRNSE